MCQIFSSGIRFELYYVTVFLLRLEDWVVQWNAFLGKGKVVFIKRFKLILCFVDRASRYNICK
jgi:hypothetical protein